MNCLMCGKPTVERVVGKSTFAQCACGFARLRASGKGDAYWEGRDGDSVNHTWADTQDALFNAVLRELAGKAPAGASIYDVGGGIGYFTELALAQGFDAHNVELSEVACARARDRIGAQRVHTSVAGMAPADVVTLWCVIGHTPDPGVFLDEVRAALKPGGWLFLTTPNWRFQAMLARVLGLRGRTINFERQDHISMFTRDSLTRLLASRGFREPVFGAWGVKERCVALGDSRAGAAVQAKRRWNQGWSRVGGPLPVDLTSEFQVLARYEP
ncbi:class I SAM-dependent methyltransferase [Dactylosporangium sp. NPDC000244]|uniref:class I SAM-dependent methyltransferase n=1 Tax=Dactylosporangium sp. NPDC000244 TaxID=3154365 RepID=UPI00332CECEE